MSRFAESAGFLTSKVTLTAFLTTVLLAAAGARAQMIPVTDLREDLRPT